MVIFFRRIAWTHELQQCQSKPLFRQSLFDEPQLNVAQAGFKEALITVNIALVRTQAINSFTHKRDSRCGRAQRSCPGGLLPSLEIFDALQQSRYRVARM